MNKKEYIMPEAILEQFRANDYVAACGDSGYNFYCDAGDRNKRYDVFVDTNNNGILDDGDRNLEQNPAGMIRYFHPCGIYHSSSEDGDHVLYDGWIIDNGGNDQLQYWEGNRWSGHYVNYTQTKVKIWTDGGTNVHCTTNLQGWLTDKS